jgi:hypothetical protein
MQAADATAPQNAAAAASLQILHWLLDQQVFQGVPVDYNIAIQLAQQWQKRMSDLLTALLLLWPAFAVTSGATHFLSFDHRTRALASSSGLVALPKEI